MDLADTGRRGLIDAQFDIGCRPPDRREEVRRTRGATVVIGGQHRDRAAFGLAEDVEQADVRQCTEYPFERLGADLRRAVVQHAQRADIERVFVEEHLDHGRHEQRVRRPAGREIAPRVHRESRDRNHGRARGQRDRVVPPARDVVEGCCRREGASRREAGQRGVDLASTRHAGFAVGDRFREPGRARSVQHERHRVGRGIEVEPARRRRGLRKLSDGHRLAGGVAGDVGPRGLRHEYRRPQ